MQSVGEYSVYGLLKNIQVRHYRLYQLPERAPETVAYERRLKASKGVTAGKFSFKGPYGDDPLPDKRYADAVGFRTPLVKEYYGEICMWLLALVVLYQHVPQALLSL